MSKPFAQFTGTNGSAEISLPVSRLATKNNPSRSAFMYTGVFWPLMSMSASTFSFTPS